jgi:hypothetical protein
VAISTCLNGSSADLNGIPPGEASPAVECIDAVFCVSPFVNSWHGIGEGAFEGDELRPADREFAGHAAAAQASGHVNRLGAAD